MMKELKHFYNSMEWSYRSRDYVDAESIINKNLSSLLAKEDLIEGFGYKLKANSVRDCHRECAKFYNSLTVTVQLASDLYQKVLNEDYQIQGSCGGISEATRKKNVEDLNISGGELKYESYLETTPESMTEDEELRDLLLMLIEDLSPDSRKIIKKYAGFGDKKPAAVGMLVRWYGSKKVDEAFKELRQLKEILENYV